MIKINKITRGRFGNRVLQYNSAYQLAYVLQTDFYCADWEGDSIFDLPSEKRCGPPREEKLITWRECLDPNWDNIKKMHDKYDLIADDPAYLLHNCFFQLTQVEPRSFLKIKENLRKNLDNSFLNVGIHIRGDDILGADGNKGREIHPPDYYINGIRLIQKEHPLRKIKFYVCSDDVVCNTYRELILYLKQNNIDFELGPATGNKHNHFEDFLTLADCDVLISSSSTYVIAAAIVGKRKKIIHSDRWLKKNAQGKTYFSWGNYSSQYPKEYWNGYDQFWLNVRANNNSFYKVWKIIE